MTQDMDLVTEERISKGDMTVVKNSKGRIISAERKRQLSVMEHFIESGHLEEHHLNNAGILLEAYRMFIAPVASRNTLAVLLQAGGGGNDIYASFYTMITKRMRPQYVRMVQRAIELTATPLTLQSYAGVIDAVQEAFAELDKAIHDARKQMKEEQEKEKTVVW